MHTRNEMKNGNTKMLLRELASLECGTLPLFDRHRTFDSAECIVPIKTQMKTRKPNLERALSAGVVLLGVLLQPALTQAQTYSVIHSFGFLTNVTGIAPYSTLVQGADGTLYGTTFIGEGNVNGGTVFKLQPDGSGFAVLKRLGPACFPDCTPALDREFPDGAGLPAGLVLSGNTLYGTTQGGGS